MSDQTFECGVHAPEHNVSRKVLYVILNASFGFGCLAYAFWKLGVDRVISIGPVVLVMLVGLVTLYVAYSLASYLWQSRSAASPRSAQFVLTNKVLEHHMGYVKVSIPYEAVKELVKPKKEGEPICLVLSDGVPVTLPVPIKDREFLMHLESRLSHAR